MRIHLSAAGLADARERLKRLAPRFRVADDDGAAVQILLASLPDQYGVWEVPREARRALRYLGAVPDVVRGLRVARIMERRGSEEHLKLHDTARKLFIDWTGVTNPDLQAVLWGNLNADDRGYWMNLADKHLNEKATP